MIVFSDDLKNTMCMYFRELCILSKRLRFLWMIKFLFKFLFSAPSSVEPRCVLGDDLLMIKLFSYLAVFSVLLNVRLKSNF